MDIQLVEKIVHEVKSQGVFDEFRKDSIADVDTKPAYQNLRQRVENTVKKFLCEQKWSIDTNKNQLREKLRRHITESGFLDVGVERIVDQVVNPKIGSVFQPRIEEIAYKYLGLPPPPKKFDPPPPPLMHPLPPLPLGAPPPLTIETSSLLPTDLEQVSPDSDNATVKSGGKDDRTSVDMDTEEKVIEDEEESPPFEPLVKYDAQETKANMKVEIQKELNIKQELEVSLNEAPNKTEDSGNINIKSEVKANNNNNGIPELNNFAIESTTEVDKEASQSVDARISQDSQLSSVSSDSRLSANVKECSLQSSSQEAVAANISEEAQMPKFNENSCEPNVANGCDREKDIGKSQLHFDIKKDEIKFEGTERKTGLESFESLAVKSEEERYSSVEDMNEQENKNEAFNFATEKMDKVIKEEEGERTPNAQELSFGSSVEDSSSATPGQTPKHASISKEKIPLEMQTLEIANPDTPKTTPTQTPYLPMTVATPSPIISQKPEKDHQSRYSSSSSSKHKKHSKERRRSYEREKDNKDSKERHRSGKESRDSSKYHSSSSTKSSNKHYTSSSSSKVYSSNSKNAEKDAEKSSSCSTHSSSKHAKHSNSHSSSSSIENQEHKKSKRDSDRRHHSSSSSSSKRSEKKDDHTEAKQKLHRRKTTDSNEDDDDESGHKGMCGSKSASRYKSSASVDTNKTSKSGGNDGKSSTQKMNEYQKCHIQNKAYSDEDPYGKMQPVNNVVILNDLLENPQTQCIQLNNTGHLVEMPQQHKSPVKEMEHHEIVSTEFNNNVELPSFDDKHELDIDEACCLESHNKEENEQQQLEENEINSSNNLCYFEEVHFNIEERLELLNATMDLCRSAVNSLRFDSFSDEGIELSNEEDVNSDNHNNKLNMLTETLKRKSEYSFEELVKIPRKRFISNESENFQSKASPTPSDTSSVNSKENEEICKNTNGAKKSLLDSAKAIQKLSQQQRYSSEDLYKPRPILGQRSRRRGMDSLV